jgi:ATP-binding cassette subfamily F protein 1
MYCVWGFRLVLQSVVTYSRPYHACLFYIGLSVVTLPIRDYCSGTYTDFEGMRGQIEAKKDRTYALQQKTLTELKASGLAPAKAEKKTLEKLGTAALMEKPKEYRVSFAMQNPGEHGPAIDVLDVSFQYPGSKKRLFGKLRFRVNTHSRVAIVGANGAGKSTLLRLLTGEATPSAGEVSRHSKLRVGVYNQHFEESLPLDKSAVEHLIDTHGVSTEDARKYLGMFGLDGARHLIRIGQLSGGQKARVVFAGLSLMRAHILILDEPTNHLDIESVEALLKALRVFEGGVVLVTHDARLIAAMECELWVCGEGDQGLRVESRGFERYKRDVLTETARVQALAERRAAERAAARKLLRDRKLQATNVAKQ